MVQVKTSLLLDREYLGKRSLTLLTLFQSLLSTVLMLVVRARQGMDARKAFTKNNFFIVVGGTLGELSPTAELMVCYGGD